MLCHLAQKKKLKIDCKNACDACYLINADCPKHGTLSMRKCWVWTSCLTIKSNADLIKKILKFLLARQMR